MYKLLYCVNRKVFNTRFEFDVTLNTFLGFGIGGSTGGLHICLPFLTFELQWFADDGWELGGYESNGKKEYT